MRKALQLHGCGGIPDHGTAVLVCHADDPLDVAGDLAAGNALFAQGSRDVGDPCLSAESPAIAFELLAQHRVQVIISDQRMPGLSGTEFLARVRQLYPKTVRIVLSGYTDLATVTDAINRGAIYRFLTKPWDDDVLRDEIRDAFRASRKPEHVSGV